MGFVLTLMYVALSLLSPGILPEFAQNLHVPLILAILIILVSIPKLQQLSMERTPDAYLTLALLFSTLLSTALVWVVEVPDTFNVLIPVLFAFFFVYLHCNTLDRLSWLARAMTVVVLFVLYQGAMAVRAGDENSAYVIMEQVRGNSLFRIRGLGVINDPNDLAQIFVSLIPLLWLWWKKGKTFSNFLLVLLPACLMAYGVFLTHSRGGTLAMIAVFLFAFKDKLGPVRSLLITGVMTVGMLALNVSGGRGMDEDDGGRVALWSAGLTAFKTRPLFGVGLSNYGNYTDHGVTAHNTYVLCLAEQGLVGYFLWMSLVVIGLSALTQIIKEQKKLKKAPVSDENVLPHLRGARISATEPAGYPAFGAILRAPAAAMNSASPSLQLAGGPQMAHFGGDFGSSPLAPATDDTDALLNAATMLRVSLVGLLTAAFFLSRAYIMTLYVLLGMAAVVRTLYREKYPDSPFSAKHLLKRNAYVVFASVTGIYLFIRLHGLH